MLQVLLAGPHQVHRRAGHLHGQVRGLLHHIGFQPTAEATTQVGNAQLHPLDVDARNLRGAPAGQDGGLRACPQLKFAVLEKGRGVQGLHHRVRQIGHLVIGFERLHGRGQPGLRIAQIPEARAGFIVQQFLHDLLLGLDALPRIEARVPLQLQCLRSLQGLPSVFGHHGHRGYRPIMKLMHCTHAWQLQGACGVHLDQAAVEVGAGSQHRAQQARHVDVRAEACAAGGLVGRVQPWGRGTDERPLRGGLEHQLGGRVHRLLRPGLRKFTVARAASGGAVQHLALRGAALLHRYLPFARGRGAQRLTRGCTGPSHGLPGGTNAGGAPGDIERQHHGSIRQCPPRTTGQPTLIIGLQRQHGVQQGGVGIHPPWGRLFDAHLGPGDVEFFGHQHRQCGVHTLAHFRARKGHRDPPVSTDAQPGVEAHALACPTALACLAVRCGVHGAATGHQSTAHHRANEQELPPIGAPNGHWMIGCCGMGGVVHGGSWHRVGA